MTTTWNAVSLPDPESWSDDEDLVGTQRRWSTGALMNDTIVTKRVIVLRWSNISRAEKNKIYTRATSFASETLLLPWGDTWSVVAVANSFSAEPVGGVSPSWNVSVSARLV